jgi:hypothetical protein
VSAPIQAPPPPPVTERVPWPGSLSPGYRLALRWTFIIAFTLLAFHRSFWDLVVSTRAESLNGYVWMVALSALLAAVGVELRTKSELPIHDRQTDLIVAGMGLGLAMLVHGVLLARYQLYFQLLRLDMLAAWLFVFSACVALFGLRPASRFAWVWLVLLWVFALPYNALVFLLGGTNLAAGMGTLLIAASATAVAVGRQRGTAAFVAVVTWSVGLLVMAVMAVVFPHAALFAFQMIPALVAIGSAGVAMFFLARSRGDHLDVDRIIEALAAKQVWAAIPVVLAMAIVLSFVRLPDPKVVPTARIDNVRLDSAGMPVPPGWHLAGTQDYPWATRYFGEDARFVRQEVVADAGDPRFDKLLRPRQVVVDTTTSGRAYAFTLFPARLLYRVSGIRQSDPQRADLGFGVTGVLYNIVDDLLLVSWNALEWTWSNGSVDQRVMVISVDNHDDDAPFPEPTGGGWQTLNAMFNVLFRGNAVVEDQYAVIKDVDLLTEFGRAVVRAKLEPAGVKP